MKNKLFLFIARCIFMAIPIVICLVWFGITFWVGSRMTGITESFVVWGVIIWAALGVLTDNFEGWMILGLTHAVFFYGGAIYTLLQ